MVTGVETAGLVLATIPLIICALENYENAIGPTKAFLRWKGHLTIAKSELYVHYAAFDQTLRILLAAVAGPDDLTTMIEDTTNELWERGDISEDLKHYLGKAHTAVMFQIEHVAEDLLEIVRHLNISGTQEPSQNTLHSVIQANPPKSSSLDPRKRYFFRDRVKFTMKRQVLKERMSKIQHNIESLTKFVERAERLDEPSHGRHNVRFRAPLESIRENASKVHEELLSRWCTSHTSHRAAILLQDRLYRRGRGRKGAQRALPDEANAASYFALCLSDHVPAQKWLSTEFRVLELPSRTSSKVAVSITAPAPTSIQAPFSNPSTLEEVVELCSYLQQRADPIFGLCLDDCRKLRAYPGNTTVQILNDTQGLTLTQILPQVPRQLANGDMYQLAIALAATVLQFIETPWLDSAWNKDGILFTKCCSRVSGNVDIKYPLLLRDFTTVPPRTASSRPNKPSSSIQVRTAFLSLGIMLLEINSGQPLESIRTAQDLGSRTGPDIDSDFITAHRWLLEQETSGLLSHGFSSAITSCLQAWLNPRADSSDNEFCTHIQESVIKPLEVEMQCLRHGL
ncbi:hypothetical protein DE146DRAFT_241713 [Phaeosphaeria sp. MPI-PUGE-AT-0046c]|nr:hypothetical protein DE146DRAFT_241713 [Phaeosphaeria sp. MPI-PUGE-AT-0046c]